MYFREVRKGERKKICNKITTQEEGWKRRCRGQKGEESSAYATTAGLVVMNCREEKGKMLELKIRKDRQTGEGREQQSENEGKQEKE